MKAFLLDPNTRTIAEVEHNGDYRNIYTLCDYKCFTTIILNEHQDTLFIDDNGMVKGPVYQFIGYMGYGQELAGKGLVLGSNAEGDATAPVMTLNELEQHVFWIERLTQNDWSAVKHGTKRSMIANRQQLRTFLSGRR